MRNFHFLVLSCLIIFVSCSKEQDLTPNPDFIDNKTASFSVEIDNQTFSSLNPQASISGGRIGISALNSLGQRVSILLDKTNTGTYSVNASGSNLLQYEPDTSIASEFYSSFYSSTPTGTISVLEIDQTARTISGTFSGKSSQTSIIITNPNEITFTNGKFKNVPYTTPTPTFNFGGIDFKEDGVDVSMNTASAGIAYGNYNGTTYQYVNFSSATANFARSIAIQLDDDRYRQGVTTYFGARDIDPISGTSADSLASVIYDVGALSGTPVFYEGISGSITIDKIETVNGQERATGTFNFIGETNLGAQINITDGRFSAIFR